MYNINMKLLFSTSILLFLLSYSTKIKGDKRLNRDILTTKSYDEIHKVAVLDQIENHIPVQRSLETRLTNSLNGLYDFYLDDHNRGFEEGWFSNDLRQKCQSENFYRMPVPSAFNDITSNRTVKNYIGWLWYQTELSLFELMESPKEWQYFIQFESVNYMSIVWLQNMRTLSTELIGSHVGGHLPFILNITNVIGICSSNESKDRNNFRLTVAVSNNLTSDTIPSGKLIDLSEQVGYKYFKFQPDFDFFHFSGIMGDINLIKLHPIHLTKVDHFQPLIDDKSNLFSIAFNVCVSNIIIDQDKMLETMLVIQLVNLNDNKKIQVTSQQILTKDNLCNVVHVGDKELESYSWLLANGNPNHFSKLVTFVIKLQLVERKTIPITTISQYFSFAFFNKEQSSSKFVGDILEITQLDSIKIKVGLKNQIKLDQNDGLLVNGQKKVLQGFGMHHEQYFSGRAMTQAAIMKDIYLLKQLGANVIRTSHYPYSIEFLEACDENGILVIAECPAVGLNSFSNIKLSLHKQILLEMMQRDNHHPSIIMWSVANEPQTQLFEAQAYFESLLEYAHQDLAQYTIKANRPLTAAIAQSHKDDKIGHTLDLIMINRYYGWYDYVGVIEAIRLPLISSLNGWANRYPGKPLMISEFGADTLNGLHSSTRGLFSEEYQDNLVVEYEKVFDELYFSSNLSLVKFWGSMLWNLADFSTHESLLRVGGNRKGLLTRDREPKKLFKNIQEIYLNRTK